MDAQQGYVFGVVWSVGVVAVCRALAGDLAVGDALMGLLLGGLIVLAAAEFRRAADGD